jgi:hypothetical protein
MCRAEPTQERRNGRLFRRQRPIHLLLHGQPIGIWHLLELSVASVNQFAIVLLPLLGAHDAPDVEGLVKGDVPALEAFMMSWSSRVGFISYCRSSGRTTAPWWPIAATSRTQLLLRPLLAWQIVRDTFARPFQRARDTFACNPPLFAPATHASPSSAYRRRAHRSTGHRTCGHQGVRTTSIETATRNRSRQPSRPCLE